MPLAIERPAGKRGRIFDIEYCRHQSCKTLLRSDLVGYKDGSALRAMLLIRAVLGAWFCSSSSHFTTLFRRGRFGVQHLFVLFVFCRNSSCFTFLAFCFLYMPARSPRPYTRACFALKKRSSHRSALPVEPTMSTSGYVFFTC